MRWNTHGKAIAMGVAAIFMAAYAAYRELSAEGISASETVLVVIAGFNVLMVWGAANIPGWTKAKTLMAAIGVVLNVLVAAIVGGLTTDEIFMLVVHFLGALGVTFAKAPVHHTNGQTELRA